jgi:archaellum component FlaC
MIDWPTKEPTDREILELILSRLTSVESRLAAIEEERAKDTKPMLAQIHKYVADLSEDSRELKERTARIERKFEVLASDMVDLRARQSSIENRVDQAGHLT